jgi:hypothetical protein
MSNPFSDLLQFLQKSTIHGRFPIYAFILLLIASCVIAFLNFKRNAEQRTMEKTYTSLARLFVWRHVVPTNALEDAADIHRQSGRQRRSALLDGRYKIEILDRSRVSVSRM